MRRVDKKANIKKANLLAESLYKKKLAEDYDYSGEEIAHTERQYQGIDKEKDQYLDKVIAWLDKFVSGEKLKENIGKYADYIEQNRQAGIPSETTAQHVRDSWYGV